MKSRFVKAIAQVRNSLLLGTLTLFVTHNAILMPPAFSQSKTANTVKPARVRSREERRQEYLKQLDNMSSQYGLDPQTGQLMRDAYQNASTQRPRASMPAAVVDVIKQSKRSSSVQSASPPADFPIPVFRGKDSTYTINSPITYATGQKTVTIRTLVVRTTDSATSIASWYRSALSQAGWKLSVPSDSLSQAMSNPEVAKHLAGRTIPRVRNLTEYRGIASRAGIKSDQQIVAAKDSNSTQIEIIEYLQKTEVTASVTSQ